MSDYLVRSTAFDNFIRVFTVDATELVAEGRTRHQSWSVSTAALGRTMIGTLFLGTMLKRKDTVTVRVQGDGPIGYIIADSDARGNVKGYIQNPQVSLELNQKNKIDVSRGIGNGQLIVTKDLGLKEPYMGQVELISGEIAEDFTYYMAASEQIPSSFGMGVLVNPDESVEVAGGFFLQVMPGATEEVIDQIEKNIQELPPITDLMGDGETPEQIVERLCRGGQPKILDKMSVQFHCDCSKKRFGQALVLLGEAEIQDMIEEDGGAEAVCHFCRQSYQFSMDDLEKVLAEIEKEA